MQERTINLGKQLVAELDQESKAEDSEQFGHPFQSNPDSVPKYSDSCRSEATLWLEV